MVCLVWPLHSIQHRRTAGWSCDGKSRLGAPSIEGVQSPEMLRACIQLALEHHVQICSNIFLWTTKPFKLIVNWDAKPHCGWCVLLHCTMCCLCTTVAMIALVAKPFAVAFYCNGFIRLASRKAPKRDKTGEEVLACWRSEKAAIGFELSSLWLNIIWFYMSLLFATDVFLFSFGFGSGWVGHLCFSLCCAWICTPGSQFRSMKWYVDACEELHNESKASGKCVCVCVLKFQIRQIDTYITRTLFEGLEPSLPVDASLLFPHPNNHWNTCSLLDSSSQLG